MDLGMLRQAVRGRYTVEDVTPSQLDRFIAAAVHFYSRYNPQIKSTTVTTVASQQDYGLPSDCVLVVSAGYYPLGELYRGLIEGEEYVYLIAPENKYRYHQPSVRVIDDIERIAHAERVAGRTEQVGKTLRLWPEPAAGGTEITVEYTAEHVLAAKQYATIPDEDFSVLVSLTLAEIFEARGLEMALEPDYAEGMQRVTKRFVPANAQEAARRLRQVVIDKYGAV